MRVWETASKWSQSLTLMPCTCSSRRQSPHQGLQALSTWPLWLRETWAQAYCDQPLSSRLPALIVLQISIPPGLLITLGVTAEL